MARTQSPPLLLKCGVYLLKCNDCPAVYIGECRRSFKVRISDHINAFFDNKPARSAFVKHLIEEDHIPKAVEILHVEGKNQKRTALESIEIAEHMVHHQYNVVNRTNVNDLLIRNVFTRSPLYGQTNL